MSELTNLGVKAIRDGVADGSFTAREVAEAFNASSTRKRSVKTARKWIEAFKLSINCELIDGCAMTSLSAARVSPASRWIT